jgi:hypothetical protein
MGLDPADEGGDVGLRRCGPLSLGERLARIAGLPALAVGERRDGGNGDDGDDGDDPAAARRTCGIPRLLLVGGGDQAPRHLDPRRLGLRRTDEAGFGVAADFGQLVAIDSDVHAGGSGAGGPRQRQQHGENRRGGHRGNREPDREGAVHDLRGAMCPGERRGALLIPAR